MTKRNLVDGVKLGETTPENSPYHDGQGLDVQVHEGTDGELYRSWFFRYKLTDGSQWGKQKYKGLGSIEVISLAAARKLVKELRMAQALAKVRNQPWDRVGESRKANAESKISRKKADAASVTFGQCAEKFTETSHHPTRGSSMA